MAHADAVEIPGTGIAGAFGSDEMLGVVHTKFKDD
jgi:hypothetical protein